MAGNTPEFKIGNRTYPMPSKLTLGELRLLKREFDLADPSKINKRDPDHIAGLLYVAMHRRDPTFSVDDLDALDIDKIEVIGADDEDDDDRPTSAAPAAEPQTS